MKKPIQTPTQEEYNLWYSRIYGYFYRRVNTQTQARDLTNETLTDFFIYPKEIEHERAFMFKIAENKLKNFIQQKVKTPAVEDIDELEIGYSVHYQDRAQHLIECAKKILNKQQFDVVEMCILCDFSSPKVASQLGISAGNVRQILSRSLQKLRQTCKQIWIDSNQ